MESYGNEEDRERLLALLNIVRDVLAHSRVPLEDLLSEGSSEVFEAAETMVRPSSDKSRQIAFDFRTVSRQRKSKIRTEERRVEYSPSSPSPHDSAAELSLEDLCELTRQRIEDLFRREDDILTSPDIVKQYLMTRLSLQESEVFSVIFLDTRHRVLAFEELFRGTIDGCSVYPRVVVKRALYHNAAALILAHNHPSSIPDPSQADKAMTKRLKDALALIDVRVLDHIVIGGAEAVSFAEEGLL